MFAKTMKFACAKNSNLKRLLVWERVTKLRGKSFVVKITAKCYEPLQKTLKTRSIFFRRKKWYFVTKIVLTYCEKMF